ncbi:Hypothetical predicted protein [Mytilus galloprovincialis]|uniref:Peptidase C14 caspase domain-containing protein n=1 Tax=Mytilus galloprovincialis TaxID=29158 RepID=A0A8B6BWI7_MYTGA|nr:Hypothetical predicted protein [Mytilus galloprovincialis]
MNITSSGIEHGHKIDINSASHGNCLTDFTDEFYKQSFPECPTQNEPSLKANNGIVSEKKDNAEAIIFHKLGELFGLNKNDAEEIIEPEDMISILDQSCTDDTLVVYSTASEKYSYGRVTLGGWMLVCLNKAVDEQLRKSNRRYHIDLLDILIAVTSAVAKNFETHLSEDNSRPCKQDDFFRQSDCFTCVLASHGGEEDRHANGKPPSVNIRDHCIYDVDCFPVITKDIINEFNKVKALKDKPKLFFHPEKYSYGRVNLGGWMLLSLKESVEEQLRQANGRYRIDLMEVLNAIASNNAHTFETHSKMYPKDPPFKTAVVFEH